MNADARPAMPAKFSRSIKWLVYGLAGLLILIAVLLAFLPIIANMAAVYWLRQQGVEASIDKISMDYNDGIISVLNARGKNAQGEGFSLQSFHLELAWQPLLHKQVYIENIELNGLQLDSMQNAEGLQAVAGIQLGTQQPPPAPAPAPADTGTAWQIRLGNISLRNIQACHRLADKNQQLCLRFDGFEWLGTLLFDASRPAEQRLQINGSLQISAISVDDKKHQQSLLSAADIKLSGLALRSMDDMAINNIRLDDWQLLPGKNALGAQQLAGFDSLQVNELHYGDRQLAIGEINLNGIAASIYRDKQGQLELLSRLQSLQSAEQQPAEKQLAQTNGESAAVQPMVVSIDTLQLADSHDIQFVDDSLPTPFKMSAQIKLLSIQHINTAKPAQPSQLKLDLLTDQHGSIQLQGSVQLLAEARSFDINGTIRGLDLRPVGSYIEGGLGHRIKSGQLNARLKLLADKGRLDSSLDLDLQQFQLKQQPARQKKDDQEKIDQEIGLPLDTALNLLRDRDNSIKLQIPVTGDVNSPDFDPSDAIRKATSTAITAAVINYYTPLGLVTAAQGLYNLATALRFEPVVFAPGSVELGDTQNRQLDKIFQLMSERPAVHVTLCGFSNRDDVAVVAPQKPPAGKDGPPELDSEMRSKLTALADRRAERVRDYLVNKGIAADRLILCEGEFSLDGVAAVEISI